MNIINFLSKKAKRKFLISCLVPIICLSVSSCSKDTQQASETTSSSTSSPVAEKSATESKETNLYSYASHLGLSEEDLENILTTEKDGKEYKLIPATNSKSHRDYWINLVTKDKDYMQTFFLNRQLPSKSRATSMFNQDIRDMWNTEKPDTLFFIVTLDGEYCGIIMSGGLVTEETPIIGYITAQEYSGKSVATTALGTFLELVKHLNDNKFYNVSGLSVWIFDDNLASITVAKKNGFIYAEADAKNKRSRYVLEIQ